MTSLRLRCRAAALVTAAALLTAAVPSPSAVADQPAPPTPRTLSVAVGGDVLIEAPVRATARRAGRATGARYDFAKQFAPVRTVLDRVDLAICHVETPIGTPRQSPGAYGTTEYRSKRLLAPYEIAAGLASAGFDRCSTASNHSYDLGVAGITSTLDALDAAGLTHDGTARSEEESRVDVLEVNGVKVAHLSYSKTSNSKKPPEWWRIRFGGLAQVTTEVAAARAQGAEIVILSLHYGSAATAAPTSEQVAWMNQMTASSDVDLVVVHSPHVVQRVEQINGVWVFWSVGNFVSGMGPGYRGKLASPRTLDGLLATARFTERFDEPGRFDVEVTPVAICTIASNRYVYPAADTLARDDIPRRLRRQLEACMERIRRVVPGVS